MKLYEANGKQQMPSFSNFSDKDVKAILNWIEAQQGGGTDDSGLLVKAK